MYVYLLLCTVHLELPHSISVVQQGNDAKELALKVLPELLQFYVKMHLVEILIIAYTLLVIRNNHPSTIRSLEGHSVLPNKCYTPGTSHSSLVI